MNDNIKEGDLYRSVTVFGKTFDLFYGYYEEYERYSKYNEPVPIYPDLVSSPVYNDEGYPFATEMQSVCEHYVGKEEEEICYGCKYFKPGDELIGLCKCEKRMKK